MPRNMMKSTNGVRASLDVAHDRVRARAILDDGRYVQFFLNRARGLVVVVVVDANERGGVEILRRTV